MTLLSDDPHDQRLRAQVHPREWRNPDPQRQYDLVVLGGGTAGLVCAAGAAGLGARVAIVEESLLGGDCLNTGCVPSKAFIRSARAASEARSGSHVGIDSDTRVHFDAVMTRLRERRAEIARHDSAARLTGLGVDVFFGRAAFSSRRSIAVDGRQLQFRRAVIATGTRPSVPEIAGLQDVGFFTNETIFSLTEQPRELAVLGAGAVGCELAQAFALLGTRVTLVEPAPRVLSREDPDAASILEKQLHEHGVDMRLGTRVSRITSDAGRIRLASETPEISADALLIATGRTPNVETLGLDTAGIAHGNQGVTVDGRLRTTNPRVFAAGDVCSRFKFTHAADAMARLALENALFFGRRRVSSLHIPWSIFTFPEIAHVGVTPDEAAACGARTVTVPLTDVDRSVVDDETEGFIRLHHIKGRVVGATVVAPHAGELIGTIVMVMQRGGTLTDLSKTVFPYPTVSTAFRQAGDIYRRQGVTPFARRLLARYFRVWRGVTSG